MTLSKMDSLELAIIKFGIFLDSVEILSSLCIEEKYRNKLNTVTKPIIDVSLEILNLMRKNNYKFPDTLKYKIMEELRFLQRRLNDTIKRFNIYKRCSKCNNRFPATCENFYKDRRIKGRFQAKCKNCKKKEGREKYKNRSGSFKFPV